MIPQSDFPVSTCPDASGHYWTYSDRTGPLQHMSKEMGFDSQMKYVTAATSRQCLTSSTPALYQIWRQCGTSTHCRWGCCRLADVIWQLDAYNSNNCRVWPWASHLHTRASVTKQYNFELAKGRWCFSAGKVTAESNGILLMCDQRLLCAGVYFLCGATFAWLYNIVTVNVYCSNYYYYYYYCINCTKSTL